VPEEESLFWNLVFWFKFANLPYLWMAPYVAHLDAQDKSKILANDQISSPQSVVGMPPQANLPDPKQ